MDPALIGVVGEEYGGTAEASSGDGGTLGPTHLLHEGKAGGDPRALPASRGSALTVQGAETMWRYAAPQQEIVDSVYGLLRLDAAVPASCSVVNESSSKAEGARAWQRFRQDMPNAITAHAKAYAASISLRFMTWRKEELLGLIQLVSRPTDRMSIHALLTRSRVGGAALVLP